MYPLTNLVNTHSPIFSFSFICNDDVCGKFIKNSVFYFQYHYLMRKHPICCANVFHQAAFLSMFNMFKGGRCHLNKKGMVGKYKMHIQMLQMFD